MDASNDNSVRGSGTIQNGVIVLHEVSGLPKETPVEISVAPPTASNGTGKRLLKHTGTVHDLPADMADQHDHYIHGTPKR